MSQNGANDNTTENGYQKIAIEKNTVYNYRNIDQAIAQERKVLKEIIEGGVVITIYNDKGTFLSKAKKEKSDAQQKKKTNGNSSAKMGVRIFFMQRVHRLQI